ncbi:MAG: hypothetical protein QM501_05240 [Gimesia sp.]
MLAIFIYGFPSGEAKTLPVSILPWFLCGLIPLGPICVAQTQPEVESVEEQPLAANVKRPIAALKYLGSPLPDVLTQKLTAACEHRDAKAIQKIIDSEVLCIVSLNPEVARGPVRALRASGI